MKENDEKRQDANLDSILEREGDDVERLTRSCVFRRMLGEPRLREGLGPLAVPAEEALRGEGLTVAPLSVLELVTELIRLLESFLVILARFYTAVGHGCHVRGRATQGDIEPDRAMGHDQGREQRRRDSSLRSSRARRFRLIEFDSIGLVAGVGQ